MDTRAHGLAAITIPSSTGTGTGTGAACTTTTVSLAAARTLVGWWLAVAASPALGRRGRTLRLAIEVGGLVDDSDILERLIQCVDSVHVARK